MARGPHEAARWAAYRTTVAPRILTGSSAAGFGILETIPATSCPGPVTRRPRGRGRWSRWATAVRRRECPRDGSKGDGNLRDRANQGRPSGRWLTAGDVSLGRTAGARPISVAPSSFHSGGGWPGDRTATGVGTSPGRRGDPSRRTDEAGAGRTSPTRRQLPTPRGARGNWGGRGELNRG
jgi:hypothetical protein